MKKNTNTSIQIGCVILFLIVGLIVANLLNIISFHSIPWVEYQPLENPVRVTEITDNCLVLEDGRKVFFSKGDPFSHESLDEGGRWIEINKIGIINYRYARYHIPVGSRIHGSITIPIFKYKLPEYQMRSLLVFTEIIDPNHPSI